MKLNKQQIIDRIMKVKALADRGIAGERTAAQLLLEELMKKYNISETDINTEKNELYIIDAGDKIFCELFCQLYRVKLGRDRNIWDIGKIAKKDRKILADGGYGDKNANLAIECTKAEFLEIKTLFEIYKTDLKRQLDTFMYAYFFKNDLLAPAEQDKESTEEEKQKAFQAIFMAQGIEKTEVIKMIKGE